MKKPSASILLLPKKRCIQTDPSLAKLSARPLLNTDFLWDRKTPPNWHLDETQTHSKFPTAWTPTLLLRFRRFFHWNLSAQKRFTGEPPRSRATRVERFAIANNYFAVFVVIFGSASHMKNKTLVEWWNYLMTSGDLCGNICLTNLYSGDATGGDKRT